MQRYIIYRVGILVYFTQLPPKVDFIKFDRHIPYACMYSVYMRAIRTTQHFSATRHISLFQFVICTMVLVVLLQQQKSTIGILYLLCQKQPFANENTLQHKFT